MRERLPAQLLGAYASVTGNENLQKKSKLGLKVSDKMYDLQKLFHYFINNHWIFESVLGDKITASMSPEERQEFNFDTTCINWRRCIADYCFGI